MQQNKSEALWEKLKYQGSGDLMCWYNLGQISASSMRGPTARLLGDPAAAASMLVIVFLVQFRQCRQESHQIDTTSNSGTPTLHVEPSWLMPMRTDLLGYLRALHWVIPAAAGAGP